MDISRHIAQVIIDEVGGIVGHQLNFFDATGHILASTDRQRIGHYHAGAAKLIREGLNELSVFTDNEYQGARTGYNLPLVMDKAVIGAIGITGEYDQVRKYGEIIKKMTEILLRDNDEQQRRKIESRIRTHFLDDWIMTEQNLSDPAFLQRAQSQDIDVSISRRAVVMRIMDITRYNDSSPGQETIDSINRRVRQILSDIPNAIFSKTPSAMICLLPMQENHDICQFVYRVFEDIQNEYGIALMAGVDSAMDMGHISVHHAFTQAMKALKACADDERRRLLFYDDMTYDLFLEQIQSDTKKQFVSRIFNNLSNAQIEEYTALLTTLYETNGSITQTSQAHFIHKNSLQYKLNLLAKTTGYDPRVYTSIPLYYLAMLFNNE